MKTAFRVLVILLLPVLAVGQQWFSFTQAWDDDSQTSIDASDLLIDFPGQDPVTVIDSRGRVIVSPEGHFIFEKTGKRVRFWGVNFTFNASFPPCPDAPRSYEPADPESAPKVAQRLAKLGINVVRFHHMDFYASPDGIFDPKYFPNETQHLDAGQLRRFDYLVHHLRRHGIYVNINLKVARHFGPGDGLPDTSLFRDSLAFFQGVSHFNQRMIELQQDYARQLLAHRNPYTGLTYAEDPGVLCVEIANEDSLFGNMLNDGGLNYLPERSGSLPERYSRELDGLWHQWLRKAYGNRESLAAAWAPSGPPVDGRDRARNGGFESGTADWWVQPIGAAQASWAVVTGSGPDGSASLRVIVTSDGTNWHVQATQGSHSIEKGHTYEVTFYARATAPAEITLDMMKGADPWSNYGLSKAFQLGTSWTKYSAAFQANATDPSHARITFELGASTNTIWIDQVEFREGGLKGLQAAESLEEGTVARPIRSGLGEYTAARIQDLFRFYAQLDEAYFVGMRRFLKEDLNLRSLVTGTAPWWAYLGDTAVQAKMDFVDGHYYWDHPWWPNVPAWSATGLVMNNRPLINSLDDLSGLAYQAVQGKPFTVSEFNEPFPNQYAHEAPLLIALVGTLQDWDAIYMFDYAGSAAAYANTYAPGFFSLAGNSVKIAQMPVAARIFLAGQSEPASAVLPLRLSSDELALGYAQGLVNGSAYLASRGADRPNFLKQRVRITEFDRQTAADFGHPVPAGNVVSSDGQITWNRENESQKFLRVDGGAVEGAVGFIRGRTHEFRGWSFSVPDGPDHLAVLLQSREPVPLREARRLILSVWTEEQNTGMVWNADHTSVDNRWGGFPTIIRPATIDLSLALPGAGAVTIYPLDEEGARRSPVAESPPGSGRYSLQTGRDRTVWYEIVVREATPSAEYRLSTPSDLFQLYTDSSEGTLQLGWLGISLEQGGPAGVVSLLEYRSRGVLTSVVRVPGISPGLSWKIPVVRDANVETAIALLAQEATNVSVRLLNAAGQPVGEPRVEPLEAGQTAAFYVPERFTVPAFFEGSLELNAPSPVTVMALRSSANASGDIFLTPLPASVPSQDGVLYFAQVAAGESFSTEFLLLNSQASRVDSRISFFNADGSPAFVYDGAPTVMVSLDPGQMQRLRLNRRAEPFFGYARIETTAGGLPSVAAVLTIWRLDSPVSEVGIPASPAQTDQLFVAVERPGRHTAVALCNPGAEPNQVDLEFLPSESPAQAALHVSVNLGPGEKRAAFLFELFPAFPRNTSGLLRARSAGKVAVLTLWGNYNERGDFLLTALTAPDRLDSQAGFAVPRILTGAGYRTMLFICSLGDQPPGGSISVHDASGKSRPLPFR